MKLITLLLFVLVLAAPAVAAAQTPPPPYNSPMRGQCMDELEKDANWRADIKADVREGMHEEEAAKWSKDQRHVILAYAAIWILTAGFVGGMWLRQGKLKGEIERLRSELDRALVDEKKP